jgi:hypothetical protein
MRQLITSSVKTLPLGYSAGFDGSKLSSSEKRALLVDRGNRFLAACNCLYPSDAQTGRAIGRGR